MIRLATAALALCAALPAMAADAPPTFIIDSATPTIELPVKPGVYVGQNILLTEDHTGDTTVRVGMWEAGISKTYLEDYPFTEYVLMISGHLVVTNDDGSVMEFRAGDTFVMPKGFSGIWDIRERMKKQMVQVGDPKARPKTKPVKD